MNLDEIDKNLLKLLQTDSKKTTKELSSKLNLSVTAVYERVKKLEREGIIEKYVVLLNRKKIEKGFVVTLLQNLQGPNGLLAVGSDLLILDKGSLVNLIGGQLSKVAEGMDPSTDGIEMVKENEYIVSCWSGVIYYVFANGNKQTLLDTRAQKINSADIGYDAKKKIVYVPTFYKNSIVAYELK